MRDALRAFILSNFMYGASPDSLDDEQSLLDTGVLDSTSVLELILHLEQTYGISIASTELVPDNLDSIARLLRFLERKGVAVAA